MRHKRKEQLSISRSRKIELAVSIYDMYIEGKNDKEIIDDLDITPQEFSIAKKFLLESKGTEEQNLSSKERFASYLIAQQQNICDLNDLITNLNSKTQYNALVGAIRLRADIQDKIIQTGQTLGIIDKEPEKKILIGGKSVSEIADKELKKGVVKAVAGLNKLMQRYGEGTKLLEISPGNLYYGESGHEIPGEDSTAALGAPPMKEEPIDNKNKAKTSKRSAGRRRVRKDR